MNFKKKTTKDGFIYFTHKYFEHPKIVYGFFSKINFLDNTENLNLLCDNLNIKKSCLFRLKQTHSSKCINLDKVISKKSKLSYLYGDGMVTSLNDCALSILTADCLPILFIDTVKKIIGACHAGWKGALSGIIENTLIEMQKIGSNESDIRLIFGPSIKKENYQISLDLKEKILNEWPSTMICFSKDKKNFDKYLFDLPYFSELRAKNVGLCKNYIIDLDTYSNDDYFFSYRRSTKNGYIERGRQISFIYQKE